MSALKYLNPNTSNPALVTLLYSRGLWGHPPPEPASSLLRGSFQSELTPVVHSAAITPKPSPHFSDLFLPRCVYFCPSIQGRLALLVFQMLTASCSEPPPFAGVLPSAVVPRSARLAERLAYHHLHLSLDPTQPGLAARSFLFFPGVSCG